MSEYTVWLNTDIETDNMHVITNAKDHKDALLQILTNLYGEGTYRFMQVDKDYADVRVEGKKTTKYYRTIEHWRNHMMATTHVAPQCLSDIFQMVEQLYAQGSGTLQRSLLLFNTIFAVDWYVFAEWVKVRTAPEVKERMIRLRIGYSSPSLDKASGCVEYHAPKDLSNCQRLKTWEQQGDRLWLLFRYFGEREHAVVKAWVDRWLGRIKLYDIGPQQYERERVLHCCVCHKTALATVNTERERKQNITKGWQYWRTNYYCPDCIQVALNPLPVQTRPTVKKMCTDDKPEDKEWVDEVIGMLHGHTPAKKLLRYLTMKLI